MFIGTALCGRFSSEGSDIGYQSGCGCFMLLRPVSVQGWLVRSDMTGSALCGWISNKGRLFVQAVILVTSLCATSFSLRLAGQLRYGTSTQKWEIASRRVIGLGCVWFIGVVDIAAVWH